jgi:hypothetical protein
MSVQISRGCAPTLWCRKEDMGQRRASGLNSGHSFRVFGYSLND